MIGCAIKKLDSQLLEQCSSKLIKELRIVIGDELTMRLQSTGSCLETKAWAHFSAVYVFLPSIRVTFLENLEVTDMRALYSFLVKERASMKSNVSIKKSTGGK